MFFWFLAMLLAFFCSGCGKNGGNNEHFSEEGSIRLSLGRIQVPLLDSITVKVSGLNMENRNFRCESVTEQCRLNNIPIGEDRKFEVKVYADGQLVLEGEAVAPIRNGEILSLPIVLNPIVGILRIEIPFGLPNTTGIVSGTLFLDGNTQIPMTIENGKGIFSTGYLLVNSEYDIRIQLYNVSGEVLYEGRDRIKIATLSQTGTIRLESRIGSAILILDVSNNGPAQIFAILPDSHLREPENFGDIFFTEIFVNPKSSGTDFKYIEIYNATLDTLSLSNCFLGTSGSGSSTTTTREDFNDSLYILPMTFFILGRDSVPFADFHYHNLTINAGTANGQSMGIFCGASKVPIDTLRYYPSTHDVNPFPIVTGIPMQLPLSMYSRRYYGTSWCLGQSIREDAVCD